MLVNIVMRRKTSSYAATSDRRHAVVVGNGVVGLQLCVPGDGSDDNELMRR